MNVVFNDYSLDGQFESIDTFLDYLANCVLDIFSAIKKHGVILLKSYVTFERKVTNDAQLYDLIRTKEINRFPEMSALRSLLVEITDEPFWDESPRTEATAGYQTDVTGDFSGSEPNCFSEALERDRLLLSFRHNAFGSQQLTVRKNDDGFVLDNITDSAVFADFLMQRNSITLAGLLEIHGKAADIIFLKNHSTQKYYVDEDIDDRLKIEDKMQIKDDFCNFVNGKNTGDMLRRLTKPIHHRSITFYEFRTTLRDSREFRIFYHQQGDRWICLCGLLKTTQATPNYIKNHVYDMIRGLQKGSCTL